MGQCESSSASIPSEHARLIFSDETLRNTQIQCDVLGIHYQLSTPTKGFKTQRLTSITRWDPQQNKEVLIAEWERKPFGKDRIRMVSNPLLISEDSKSEDEFVLVSEFLQRTKGVASAVDVDRTFTANNGRCYTWEIRSSSLKLYEEGSKIPAAEYKEQYYLFNKRPAHLQLAPGLDEVLDYVVVTCAIAVEMRLVALQAAQAAG